MIKINRFKRVADILNSEGTILGLYQLHHQLFLGSYLADNLGTVYYSTTKEILQQYLNSEITLNQAYLACEAPLVYCQSRKETVTYLKQDFADKITCGKQYYNEISDGMNNRYIQDELKAANIMFDCK
jgi:hypothetical protein